MRFAPHLFLGTVVCAAGFAYFNGGDHAPTASAQVSAAPPPPTLTDLEEPHATQLPPNHPMIGPGGPIATVRPTTDEPPAIAWKMPEGWKMAANPNAMRIATYRVLAVASDSDDAEVSVSRAGGTTDANIERWLGQFDDAGKETRVEKTVRGMKVTTVDVSGTYLGGMTPGASNKAHTGWSLAAAIVETSGSPYFIKMIGPSKTVRAAHAALDKMVDGITPAP